MDFSRSRWSRTDPVVQTMFYLCCFLVQMMARTLKGSNLWVPIISKSKLKNLLPYLALCSSDALYRFLLKKTYVLLNLLLRIDFKSLFFFPMCLLLTLFYYTWGFDLPCYRFKIYFPVICEFDEDVIRTLVLAAFGRGRSLEKWLKSIEGMDPFLKMVL